MNTVLRRAVCTLSVIGALVLSTASTADAAPAQTPVDKPVQTAGAKYVPAGDTRSGPTSEYSTLSLSCPDTMLCIWPNTDGSSGRCTWVNADVDWRTAPVTCSWTSSQKVKAIVNNGTSASYSGVCLYGSANYVNPQVYLAQGWWVTSTTGWSLRSHRWVTSPC